MGYLHRDNRITGMGKVCLFISIKSFGISENLCCQRLISPEKSLKLIGS
jgi:hypothetical protein